MPLYPGPSKALLLYENKQSFLFQKESIVAGQSSIAVQLRRERGAAYPFGASFKIQFSGAPGPFQVDIQSSDQDVESDFVSLSSLTGGLNGSNVGRIELPSFWAKFVRANVVVLTNAVTLTVEVTR